MAGSLAPSDADLEAQLGTRRFRGTMETPRTVDQVFDDYSARRSGLLKALTADVDEFYTQCDPDKENLCLYGAPQRDRATGFQNGGVPLERRACRMDRGGGP